MSATLRIWVDGELRMDKVMPGGEIDVQTLGNHLDKCRTTVAAAAAQGRPWRLELGDQDADVTDGYWLG
jgi:hypothetical protein